MTYISRRTVLASLAITPLAASLPVLGQEAFTYNLVPERVADQVWVVRGADMPISVANGGAIANIGIIGTPMGTVLFDSGPSMRYGKALKSLAESLTGKPVVRVFISHLHPDHGFGLGAFSSDNASALPETIHEIERDGAGFSDAMYRMLGDWMRGTEVKAPLMIQKEGVEDFGGRRIRAIALSGHSEADLCLLDEASGTLFAGDLVFHNRAPATPDANLAKWRTSLDTLLPLPHAITVPGHGPVDSTGTTAIHQTHDWLDWLEKSIRNAIANGLDMVEAGNIPIPERFAEMAAARYELQRSISHFYPRIEAELMLRIDVRDAASR